MTPRELEIFALVILYAKKYREADNSFGKHQTDDNTAVTVADELSFTVTQEEMNAAITIMKTLEARVQNEI